MCRITVDKSDVCLCTARTVDLGLRQWHLQLDNTAGLLNSLYELVQQHQALLSSRENLQEELQKLRVDVKTADKTIQRLQGQTEHNAQEAGGLSIKVGRGWHCSRGLLRGFCCCNFNSYEELAIRNWLAAPPGQQTWQVCIRQGCRTPSKQPQGVINDSRC